MHSTFHKKIAVLLASLLLGATFTSLFPAAAEETWQWTTPTPGAPNAALPLAPSEQSTITNELPLGSFTVVINEVFPAGSKVDLEFVEIYNFGASDVNISGLRLMTKAGKEHVFANETYVRAKSYLVVKGVLPLADTAETVVLMRGTEELDRLEFMASLPKGEMSAGRYCDVYELRFCEVKRSVPTPGFVNTLEPLSVTFSPADAVLQAGESVTFTSNIAGARIILTQKLASQHPDDSFVYTRPLKVGNGDVYWYFAQHEGQATIPQKVTFRVEEPKVSRSGLKITEVMVDDTTKKGWVEIYNAADSVVDISALHVDTRASISTLCTTCATFVQTQKLAANGYALLELPRATVTQLLARKTPVDVRLMNRQDVLDTLTVPLATMRGQWKSWIVYDTALMLHGDEEADSGWTDIPTPGLANVQVDVAKTIEPQLLTKQILSRLVYVQAAYEDDKLIVRGKTLPGLTMRVLGNGAQLAELVAPNDGLWSLSFDYAKTKEIPHLLFQLITADGMQGLLSVPFPVPAYDGEDPRQTLPRKIMTTAGGGAVSISTSNGQPTANVPTQVKLPFEHLPLLSSMSGVVLTEVSAQYNLNTQHIAPLGTSHFAMAPMERVVFSLTDALLQVLTFGLSR